MQDNIVVSLSARIDREFTVDARDALAEVLLRLSNHDLDLDAWSASFDFEGNATLNVEIDCDQIRDAAADIMYDEGASEDHAKILREMVFNYSRDEFTFEGGVEIDAQIPLAHLKVIASRALGGAPFALDEQERNTALLIDRLGEEA